ncbi:hypothetical protein C8F01DRAFT_1160206 [Mycena amicta]|nr:hypothetical protein C8F01DRAFT_1160206 [Mycena amicta]
MLDLFTPLAWLFALSAMILPTALIFGITMPFVGTLVRYWGNYTPKQGSVRLDGAETTSTTESGNVGYFGMMKRVHKIEGWSGLYKGIMPSLVSTLIAMVAIAPAFALLAAGHKMLPNGRVYIPPTAAWLSSLISYAFSILPTMLLIPIEILINRAITTPHTLSSFAPTVALNTLLSPTERAAPLRLYLAPGVALSAFLPAVILPTINLLWGLALVHLPRVFWNAPLVGVALPMILLTSALLTPLHVMHTKLTLQRQGEIEPAVAEAVLPEDEVMGFRTEEVPYTGLVDCARCVVNEEGWRVLFRAWWITPLGLGLPMIAQSFVGDGM